MISRDELARMMDEAAQAAVRGVLRQVTANGTLQVSAEAGRTLNDVVDVQPYGYYSRPRPSAEMDVVVLQQCQAGPHVVGCIDKSRPSITDGEVILYDAQGSYIRLRDDENEIEVDATTIQLGSGATNFVALANLVLDRLNTLQAAHDSHNHPTAPTGPVSPPNVIVGSLASVAATKVKAE